MENNNQQQNEQTNLEKNNAAQLGKKAIRDIANMATKKLRTKVKMMITAYLTSVVMVIVKIVAVMAVVLLVSGVIEWIVEKFEAKESPEIFEKALGIEDMDTSKIITEFITIKKDEEGDGYHFEFKEGFDEKVKKGAEAVGRRFGNLSDPELWKEFLMADFATQLPNLGGSGQVISNSISSSSSDGSGYWWPIGSSETTTKNGKTFASGEPEIPHGTNVVEGGFSKGWCTTRHFKTSGEAMDIAGNNQIGHYNVISMAKGVVERADDGYSDSANFNDNGGMGNCVYVRYPGNILVRYMHLSKGTVTVKTGDEVDYGQVLGKMGHSGASYQPHLHIDMWIGAENSTGGQDIAAYFDATNPRPSKISNVVSSLDGFLFIGDSITVGLEKNGKVDGKDLTFVGSTGSTPKQWLEDKTPASGEKTYSRLPKDSDSIKGISIMLGTNEVSQTEEYKQLIEKIHEKYPEKPIYVQKIMSFIYNSKSMDIEVANYNSSMQQFCNDKDYATFIDATKDVEISDDGIHPTVKGYKTLAKNIKNAITSIKENGSTSIFLKPEDEQETTDEITEDEEDFINKAPKEFQGTIKLKRITPSKNPGSLEQNAGIKTIELKYVEPETFEGYVNSGDEKALSTFTLSEDYSEIITAKWSYEGGLKVESNSGIDYRNLTASYAMPYQYPMMYHVTGKDALFSQRLMYLVLGSSVDMVLVDNVTTTQTKVTTIQTTTTKGKPGTDSTTSQSITNTSYSYKENVYTTTELGAVNSWWAKRSSTFSINSNMSTSYGDGQTSQSNEKDKIITTQEKIEETIANYNINSSNTDFEGNEEPFSVIYNGSNAKGNTQEDWLLDFLGDNDRTANMVELTKYLLYKATGVDYGVTNFEDITFGNMEGISSGYSGNDIMFDFIASWENSALYQYMKSDSTEGYNSNVYIYKCVTEDKKSYKCVEDIGMNNGTRNFGFGVCHYNPRDVGLMKQDLYAEEGINIADSKYMQEGTLIDVEIVDRIKRKIIDQKRTEITNLTQGLDLTENQINALIDLSYQRGNINGFVSAYKQYGNTDELRNHFSFNDPNSSRTNARWQLFHNGVYKSGTGETLDPKNYMGGTIGEKGDGYDEVFKSASGKAYKLFIQNRYSNVPYWGSNIKQAGCGPTSAAIILSGFGINDGPQAVAQYAANGSWGGECYFFTSRGLKCEQAGVDWNRATQHLKNGNPMVASINGPITINGSYYTGHFITFLDIKDDKIFIGDPYNDGYCAGTSWQKISFLQNSGAFGQFFFVSK